MWFMSEGRMIAQEEKRTLMLRLMEEAMERISRRFKKVLLLPPDITRLHSGTGELTNILYHLLSKEAEVDVIPTLGQHVPHTPEDNARMFGDIPQGRIKNHDWRETVKTFGEVAAAYVRKVTKGRADWAIPVEINPAVKEGGYDLVVHLGQIVPHEVLGFASHNKNYFIGLGGKGMICASHMAAGAYGIERNMGQLVTPLRACFNKAESECLSGVPAVYVLVVNTRDESDRLGNSGLYVGTGLEPYLRGAMYSSAHSIRTLDKPLKKCVCFMDGDEFRSTWVANKAIYRTRMAMADGGELLVIAPGVERFGEQQEVDRLIRKYGYKGTPHTMDAYANDPEMRDFGHASAHLLHGSTEGRFDISYAPGRLSRAEVESVGYSFADCKSALAKYNPSKMREGWNTVDGEDVYFIGSPSMGLWCSKPKFAEATLNNSKFIDRMALTESHEASWTMIRECNAKRLSQFAI